MDTVKPDTHGGTTTQTKPKSHNWGGRRKGAGRPGPSGTTPGTPGTRRKAHSIKFSDQEWADLTARAAAAGLTVAEYVRQKALF